MKRLQLLPRLPLLALAVVTALLSGAASAKQMTICGEKIDYSAAENSGPLVGIWMGDLQAANVAYGVEYLRCVAFLIESIDPAGKVVAKHVSASVSKNFMTGASYGSKAFAGPWNGRVTGKTLRFESDDKKTSYDLDLPASGKMEGRFTGRLGNGRVWLKRQ